MDLTKAKVGVTGASGMLGVYLCRSLLAAGAKVRGVTRMVHISTFAVYRWGIGGPPVNIAKSRRFADGAI